MNNSNLRLPEQNSVTLVGRLTRDPEVRYTTKGQAVCRIDIAVNRRYKDAQGAWQDLTSFIPIVVWGESATRCGERLKKGMPVHVEGRLQSRAWETKEGQKRTSIEVVARRVQFLSKPATESSSEAVAEDTQAGGASEPEGTGSSNDEEIPF
jgi:single-strand DNA-binding protein